MTTKKRKKKLMSLIIKVGLHLQPTEPTNNSGNHKHLSDKNIGERRCREGSIPLKPLPQIESRGNPVQPARLCSERPG
ncbi:hypothetical protein SUGI_0442280 [Cryptomeria japonica]|nr:hypothetical protein SUGI_0442280 [Cryptomeria japonica]